jgi:hypothetical protein
MNPDLFGNQYESTAVVSSDKQYRYQLARRWGKAGKTIAFICLNPSTADADTDDPTVRRCIGYTKYWGGTQLLVGNLFGYRATDPRQLLKVEDPVGLENDIWLSKIIDNSDIALAAWGVLGSLRQRDAEVLTRYSEQLYALRLTKNGSPSHPLYLSAALKPFRL